MNMKKIVLGGIFSIILVMGTNVGNFSRANLNDLSTSNKDLDQTKGVYFFHNNNDLGPVKVMLLKGSHSTFYYRNGKKEEGKNNGELRDFILYPGDEVFVPHSCFSHLERHDVYRFSPVFQTGSFKKGNVCQKPEYFDIPADVFLQDTALGIVFNKDISKSVQGGAEIFNTDVGMYNIPLRTLNDRGQFIDEEFKSNKKAVKKKKKKYGGKKSVKGSPSSVLYKEIVIRNNNAHVGQVLVLGFGATDEKKREIILGYGDYVTVNKAPLVYREREKEYKLVVVLDCNGVVRPCHVRLGSQDLVHSTSLYLEIVGSEKRVHVVCVPNEKKTGLPHLSKVKDDSVVQPDMKQMSIELPVLYPYVLKN